MRNFIHQMTARK